MSTRTRRVNATIVVDDGGSSGLIGLSATDGRSLLVCTSLVPKITAWAQAQLASGGNGAELAALRARIAAALAKLEAGRVFEAEKILREGER